jgi:hypothetical protein
LGVVVCPVAGHGMPPGRILGKIMSDSKGKSINLRVPSFSLL